MDRACGLLTGPNARTTFGWWIDGVQEWSVNWAAPQCTNAVDLITPGCPKLFISMAMLPPQGSRDLTFKSTPCFVFAQQIMIGSWFGCGQHRLFPESMPGLPAPLFHQGQRFCEKGSLRLWGLKAHAAKIFYWAIIMQGTHMRRKGSRQSSVQHVFGGWYAWVTCQLYFPACYRPLNCHPLVVYYWYLPLTYSACLCNLHCIDTGDLWALEY